VSAHIQQTSPAAHASRGRPRSEPPWSRRAKLLARDAIAGGLELLGVTLPSRGPSGRLAVATFHRVLPEELIQSYPLPGLCVTPQELDWFLNYFQDRYDCGSFGRCVAVHRTSQAPTKPLMAITFDDGQLDNVRYALPVLARRGVTASFFVPVRNVEEGEPLWHDRLGFALGFLFQERPDQAWPLMERFGLAMRQDGCAVEFARRGVGHAKQLSPDRRDELVKSAVTASSTTVPQWAGMMSWDDVRSVADAGHEVGSHSMTHCLLPDCDDQALDYEIRESKRRLEAVVGQVRSFCYPNGDYDDRCLRLLADAGYQQACTTRWGDNAAGCSPFTYNRFDMNPEHVRSWSGKTSRAVLAWRLSRWFARSGVR